MWFFPTHTEDIDDVSPCITQRAVLVAVAVDEVIRIDGVTDMRATVATAVPSGSVFSLTVSAADRVTALRINGTDGRASVVQVR